MTAVVSALVALALILGYVGAAGLLAFGVNCLLERLAPDTRSGARDEDLPD